AVTLENGRFLELAPNSEQRNLGLVEPGEIEGAVEEYITGVGPGLAGHHIHHRGLAGAVRPDDGPHLARLDRDRQVVERTKSVERHGNTVEIEQRRCGLDVHPPLIRPDAARPRASPTPRRRPPRDDARTTSIAACRRCRAATAR